MKTTEVRLRKMIREALIRESGVYVEPADQADQPLDGNQWRSETDEVMQAAGLTAAEMKEMWKWIKLGDPDYGFYDSPQFEKLYGYLFFDNGIMPYGVAKARDGEPDQWIIDYLSFGGRRDFEAQGYAKPWGAK